MRGLIVIPVELPDDADPQHFADAANAIDFKAIPYVDFPVRLAIGHAVTQVEAWLDQE